MQKKLALIEPYHHSEVLRTFAQFFLHLGWQVAVFTNQQVKEDCYELPASPEVEWYIPQAENTLQFINQHQARLEDCDLVIFVTLLSLDGLAFRPIDIKPKTILVIHNGNTFFAAAENVNIASAFKGGPKDLLRWFLFWGRNERKRKQRLLENFDYLSLAAASMSDYFVQQKRLTDSYKFMDPLPFAFFEGIPKKEKKSIRIGITGTVRGEGRDYEKVWKAFQKLVPELRESVDLVFLGGAKSKYAKDLLNAFQEIENDFFKIQFAPDFIAQKEFDIELRKVDFLIMPLKESYHLGPIQEIYGHTNISGGVNDMIRFGIPALISPYYPLSSELEEMSERYESVEDLTRLLKQWIEERRFQKIREKVPQLLANYQKEILAKRLAEELDTIWSQ